MRFTWSVSVTFGVFELKRGRESLILGSPMQDTPPFAIAFRDSIAEGGVWHAFLAKESPFWSPARKKKSTLSL